MATIEDVAEKAGVSKSTVSHVINETRYVSPELTEKVRRAMEELNYHSPNAIARGLKTQKTYTVGLIVSDITNMFSPYLARGLEGIASERGYNVIVSNTDELIGKEQDLIDSLIEQRVDGVVIAPTGKDDDKINLLREQDIPFVFLDRKVSSIEADFVTSNNEEGAYKATKHLLENGHERIGTILGPECISTSRSRYNGYKIALEEEGIEVNQDLLVRGDYKLEGGQEVTEKLLNLDRPPTALFSTNLMSNLGALKAIKNVGLKCPDDISLVGFDDVPWIEMLQPPLSVVSQKPYEMGYKAGALLFERLNDQRKDNYRTIKLETDLIKRNSVKVIT
ncbi:MAG: LacI family DNA-binding transcriptional regulator [Candidatus Bipolaricaulota bacterium]|nr:LacI family DNA-binding transcriptional regulator [Candidatus Bipolaricaulota bacterium]MBS3791332.1 LacI family DNA-binding transcriptional regulator [Candidatus Bipolaricaulota bacterium]